MAYALSSKRDTDPELILDLLSRLWQTKLKSITALEKWQAKTVDAEIKAGLYLQLIDERRHLRLLGDEIKRLGGRMANLARENFVTRPFVIFEVQPNDLLRLSALHYGIKAFTHSRCNHLLRLVDTRLARALEQISSDEERHIRWADIRIARLESSDDILPRYLLNGRMQAMLEAAWSKPWRALTLPRRVRE
jgi:hypothetical protein